METDEKTCLECELFQCTEGVKGCAFTQITRAEIYRENMVKAQAARSATAALKMKKYDRRFANARHAAKRAGV